MSFKPFLADRVLSLLVGLLGLVLLGPLLLGLAMLVALTTDGPAVILRRVLVEDHPLDTVLLFDTRCRAGDFLRRHKLHLLPALISLVNGRLTVLDVVEIDWTRFH